MLGADDRVRTTLGLGRYRMRAFVAVLSAGELQKWMDEKVKEQAQSDV